MAKFKFYSDVELKKLREIKNLTRREKTEALKTFSKDSGRTYSACFNKMWLLKPSVSKKSFSTGGEVRIPLSSITIVGNELILKF